MQFAILATRALWPMRPGIKRPGIKRLGIKRPAFYAAATDWCDILIEVLCAVIVGYLIADIDLLNGFDHDLSFIETENGLGIRPA